MDDIFKSIYFDESNPASFGSIIKLYRAAKAIHPAITLRDTKNWLSKQYEYTLYKQTERNFERNKIFTNFINEVWEIDSLHYVNYSRYNYGYKYLIMIIDAFSKYLIVIPVKTLRAEELIPKFTKLFRKVKPMKIRTDRGLEFNNRHFISLCQRFKIKFYTTSNQTKKAAIVERVNRTIRNKIRSYLAHKNTLRYIDALKQIVKSYNHSIHGSTHMAPIDIDESDERKVFKNMYGHPNMLSILKNQKNMRNKFERGQEVRQKFDEKLLDKGYVQKWSDQVYKIRKVYNKLSKPQYTIALDDRVISRRFYPEELQIVRTTPNTRWIIEKILRKRKRNNIEEVLVRFRGFAPEYDQWIPLTHLREE